MEKKKKFFIKTTIGIGVILTIGFLIDRNRKQQGIIQNQQLTIDGLIRDVKNLSYHLGKANKT